MTGYFDWDEEKSRQCMHDRGFGFEVVEYFDFAQAVIIEDNRQDYGERRFRAFGYVSEVAFSIVFTPRGKNLRIVSVRRAHEKELKRYGKSQENP